MVQKVYDTYDFLALELAAVELYFHPFDKIFVLAHFPEVQSRVLFCNLLRRCKTTFFVQTVDQVILFEASLVQSKIFEPLTMLNLFSRKQDFCVHPAALENSIFLRA